MLLSALHVLLLLCGRSIRHEMLVSMPLIEACTMPVLFLDTRTSSQSQVHRVCR